MNTTKGRRLYYRAMSRVLTYALTSKSMKVAELASKTGLAVSTINNALTGMTATSWLTVLTIVRGLEIDLNEFANTVDMEEKSMMKSVFKEKT